MMNSISIRISQGVRILVAILLILNPIIYNPLGFDVFALPRAFFLWLVALAILVLGMLDRRPLPRPAGKTVWMAVAFGFFILLSFCLARDKYVGLWGYFWDYEGLLSWLSYFVVFYSAFRYFDRPSLIKLGYYLSYPLIAVGLYAAVQYFADLQLMDWAQSTEIRRASSLLGHPSYLGLYALLLLPLQIAVWRTALGRWQRRVILSGIVFGFLALLLSFSRGAWLAAASVGGLWLLLNRRRLIAAVRTWRTKIVLSVALVLAGLTLVLILARPDLPMAVYSRLVSIADPNSPTIVIRKAIWRQSLGLWQDNWLLGLGPDNYPYAITPYFERGWHTFNEAALDKAHNLFLDYWLAFGLGGIVTFTLLLGIWIIDMGRFALRQRDLLAQGIWYAVLAYLLGLQFHYTTVDLAPIFWFYLGGGISLYSAALPPSLKSWDKFGKTPSPVFPLAVIPVMLLVLFLAYQRLSADMLFRSAMDGTNSADESIALLEQAVDKYPRNSNYYLALGKLCLDEGTRKGGSSVYFQKGLDALIAGAGMRPLDYRLHYQLGDAYLRSAEYAQNRDYVYDQGRKAYLGALELYPAYYQIHLKLGVVSAHLGEGEEARQYWQNCLQLNPRADQCYYNLYVFYNEKGETDLAQVYYRQYLDLHLQ